MKTSGQFSETIQCPYHAWTYTTDGRLIGAPHMHEVEGFDKRDFPLHAAAIAECEGFLFVNVSDNPQPFDQYFAPMMHRLSRFGLADLEVGHSVRYEVQANWKLVFQNYSECLHCPLIHPELSLVLPYQSGANDLIEGPFLGGYMEISAPNESATLSGRACGRPVTPDLPEADRRRAFYYTLMPNLMLSIHPDYVNFYMLTPDGVDRTIVESEWMFSSGEQAQSGLQSRRRHRVLGRDQPAGLGHRRVEPAGDQLAPLRARPVLATREHAGRVGSGVPEADGVGPVTSVHRSTGPPAETGATEPVRPGRGRSRSLSPGPTCNRCFATSATDFDLS